MQQQEVTLREVIPDVQFTSQKLNLDLEVIITLKNLYARAWDSDLTKLISETIKMHQAHPKDTDHSHTT